MLACVPLLESMFSASSKRSRFHLRRAVKAERPYLRTTWVELVPPSALPSSACSKGWSTLQPQIMLFIVDGTLGSKSKRNTPGGEENKTLIVGDDNKFQGDRNCILLPVKGPTSIAAMLHESLCGGVSTSMLCSTNTSSIR